MVYQMYEFFVKNSYDFSSHILDFYQQVPRTELIFIFTCTFFNSLSKKLFYEICKIY